MVPLTPEDKVKVGYQAAIALITYEGQVIWRAFAAMLSANAALVAASGALPKLAPNFASGSYYLSGLGLIICLAWFLTLCRQFSYYRYWFAWARHLEKLYLSPEVTITLTGKTYGEGGSVEADSVPPSLPRFGWWSRLFCVQWLMGLVIVVFAVLHFLAILLAAAP